MLEALFITSVATGGLTILYGTTDRPIYKYLAYIGAIAFAVCTVIELCIRFSF